MSQLHPNHAELTVEERLVELEKAQKYADGRIKYLDSQVVDSWATQTRETYEKEFKAEVKERLVGFATYFLLGAVLFLAGAGYVIMKAVVNDSVNTTVSAKYQGAIDDLKRTFDDKYHQQVSWQTDHNTGVARRQLAEFYFRTANYADENQKKKSIEQIEGLLKKAVTSFSKATIFDSDQASSHWELGELFYTYPRNFDLPALINREEALKHYQEALKHYNEYEVLRGWKAQCYYDIGSIYADYVKEPTAEFPAKSSKERAVTNLENALKEYDRCQTCDSDADQAKNKVDARKLLDELKKSN